MMDVNDSQKKQARMMAIQAKLDAGYRLVRIGTKIHLIAPFNNGGDNINAARR